MPKSICCNPALICLTAKLVKNNMKYGIMCENANGRGRTGTYFILINGDFFVIL